MKRENQNPERSTVPVKIVKRNAYCFRLTANEMETPKGVSMTVADQSYSVRDLYEKFTHGIDPGAERSVTWGEDDVNHDDQDLGQVALLDPSEKHELLMRTREQNQRQLDLLKDFEAKEKSRRSQDKKPESKKEESSDDQSPRIEEQKDDQKAGGKKTSEKGESKSTTPT